VSLACVSLALAVVSAQAAGKVEGRVSVNGKPATLTFVAAATVENLFDSKKRDVIVVLAGRAVPADIEADDDVMLSMHARKGEFRAVGVRIDSAKKVVNVKLFDQGIQGVLMYGANDFELAATAMDAKRAAGRVRTKAPTKFDGTTLDLDATFDAVIGAAPAPAPPAPAARVVDGSAALNQLLLKKLTFTPADFLKAAASQSTSDVQLFLDAGMSPDTPGGPGTPLFGAKTALV
jgi:hypothetical protein